MPSKNTPALSKLFIGSTGKGHVADMPLRFIGNRRMLGFVPQPNLLRSQTRGQSVDISAADSRFFQQTVRQLSLSPIFLTFRNFNFPRGIGAFFK
jgi:hypothetical protein